MSIMRLRVTGDESQAEALVTALHGLPHVRGVEQIADQMRGVRDDSSSNALVDDIGPDLHCLEVEINGRRNSEDVRAMAEQNAEKAKLLYDFLDQSEFFKGTAEPDSRSLMNVCFRAPTEDLEAKFVAETTKRGLDGLKGHRSVGGMRASIYNAFPRQGVAALVNFMKEFEKANRAAVPA